MVTIVGRSGRGSTSHIEDFIQFLIADEFLRRRKALLDLETLLREDHRRVGEAAVLEARRAGELVPAGIDAAPVGLGGELSGDVAGAHAQLQHDRRVACLRQLKAFLDGVDDRGQVWPRIEQPHRAFHGVGVGALLDHARAFAVVLAQDDERAANDAGRSQVRQRIGRHIGADDRLPGHGAAQRIVNRGAQHGGG